jgi:hypothetical protein
MADGQKKYSIDIDVTSANNNLTKLNNQLTKQKTDLADLNKQIKSYEETLANLKMVSGSIGASDNSALGKNIKEVEKNLSAARGESARLSNEIKKTETGIKQNTKYIKEYEAAQKVVTSETVKTEQAVVATNQQLQQTVKTTQQVRTGMSGMLSVMQGLSSIAAVGIGVQNIFGDSEEFDLTSMHLFFMAQAVRQVQEEIKAASTEGNGFFSVLNKIGQFASKWSGLKWLENTSNRLKENINLTKQLNKETSYLVKDIKTNDKNSLFKNFNISSVKSIDSAISEIDKKIKKFESSNLDVVKQYVTLLQNFKDQLLALSPAQKKYVDNTLQQNKVGILWSKTLIGLNSLFGFTIKGLLAIGNVIKTGLGMIGFIALLSLLYDGFSALIKIVKEFTMGAEWAKQMNIIKSHTESATASLQAYIDKLEYLQAIKAITEQERFSKALLETSKTVTDLTDDLEKLMTAQDKLDNVSMKKFFSSREQANQFAGQEGVINPRVRKVGGLNNYIVDYEVDVRFNEAQAKQAFKNINKWLDENLIEGNGFFSGRNIKDSDFELNVNGLVATLIDDFKQLKGLSVDSKEFEDAVMSLYDQLMGMDWQRVLGIDEYWKGDREEQKKFIDSIIATVKQEQGLLIERNKWRVKNAEELANQLIDIEKRIRSWETNSMDNDYQRGIQSAYDNRQNEVDSLNKLLKDEKITQETYNRAMIALEKSHTEDLVRLSRDRANKIYQLEQDSVKRLISINPNENSRTLAELKNTYDNELKTLKDSRREGYITESAYQKNRLAITQEYNYKVGQEMRRFHEEQRAAMVEFNRQREEFNRTFFMNENSFQIEELNLEQSQYKNTDIDSQFFDRVSKGYEKLVKNVTEYQQALMKLQSVEAELNAENSKVSEVNAYEQNLQLLDTQLENGIITQEEYNVRSIRLWVDLEDKITQINAKLYQDLEKISVQGFTEITNATSDGMSKMIASMGGLSDFNETFDMKRFIEENKKAKQSLIDLLNSGKITKEDFDKLWEEMKQSEADFWKNFKQYALGIASESLNMVNNIIGSIGDILDAGYKEQLDNINKEIELLDKLYSEQEAMADKHKDRMNEIEDSLSSARGDRRDQLIDQLAAEKSSYIKSYAAQQDAQRKKEALEKQAVEVERQRNIQQQKIQVLQAMVSGAMAITNALATPPFIPVGIAMGALATGMVAAQIAAIKAVKYENGGLLTGKSHKDGGMPILGSNIEVEGGEYVVNKRATKQYYSLLEAINNGGKSVRKFAQGGTLPVPTGNKQMSNIAVQVALPNVQVSVVDINNAMSNVENVKVLAGY